MDQSITLPGEVPVMPLQGAVLFPHALLPLHIFEPRYQQMLEHALHHHRMFCVALVEPNRPQWPSIEDFFQIATVGGLFFHVLDSRHSRLRPLAVMNGPRDHAR